MINDPYRVLGVPSSASNDELKKAYRNLSKKYHPDANLDQPEVAEQKFKEVQEAYQIIMDMRESGTAYQRESGSYGNYGGGFSQRTKSRYGESMEMQAVCNYLNAGYFQEAYHVLNGINEADRDARWYYYSSIANAGLGNNATALEHAQRAVALEPSNMEYQSLLNRLRQGGFWYQERGTEYGRGSVTGNVCLELCFLNLCCGLCCRPF